MAYRILEHSADDRIFARADTPEELFADALRGMMALLKPVYRSGRRESTRTIKIDAPDRTALLIDFLSDALYNSQIYKEGYRRVSFKRMSETAIEAELVGNAVRKFEKDVKAVTYHEADVKKGRDGKWETAIVFDV